MSHDGNSLTVLFSLLLSMFEDFHNRRMKNNQQPKLFDNLPGQKQNPAVLAGKVGRVVLSSSVVGGQKHKGSGAALPPPTLSFFLYLYQRRVHFQPSASPRTMQLSFRAPKAFPRQLVGSRVNGLMNKENTHEL